MAVLFRVSPESHLYAVVSFQMIEVAGFVDQPARIVVTDLPVQLIFVELNATDGAFRAAIFAR